jgi:uncharacterized protein YbbK (DUF523 family)
MGGASVLEGEGRVVTNAGVDVTEAFLRGAEHALVAARDTGVKLAVLKENSPSCGSRFVYDGTFTRTRKEAQGVTAALLERNGVRVFSDVTIDRAVDYLHELELQERSRSR